VTVVLDAVVFVRALMNRHNIWGRLLARADEYAVLLSLEIVDELLGVIQRPELRQRLYRLSGLPELQSVLSVLALAEGVEPGQRDQVCRDPKDDKYFWCALAGHADYIVSEDEDILAVGEYHGIRTVRAAEFLRILDRTKRNRRS
jgi:putative PIN family toxin of toxin-antitoxin system